MLQTRDQTIRTETDGQCGGLAAKSKVFLGILGTDLLLCLKKAVETERGHQNDQIAGAASLGGKDKAFEPSTRRKGDGR